MKPVTFTKEQFEPIWQRIKDEHGAKVNIGFVCKRILGFTVRLHITTEYDHNRMWLGNTETICLDFYDESMRTFFLLKYTGEQPDAS